MDQNNDNNKTIFSNCKSSILSHSRLEDYSIGLNELADTFIRPTSSQNIFNSTRLSDGYERSKKLDRTMSAYLETKNHPNRSYLKNLFEILIFLAKQGILYRDNVKQNSKNSSSILVNGQRDNLIELLKFRSRDLPLLKAYFITENPMSFRGSRIEREFVEILHEQIVKKIASEIGNRPYSIILNEIAEKIKGDKVAFILRYVDEQGHIQERFISFESAVSTSDAELERLILTKLKTLKLSPSRIVAQAYEGINGTANKIYKDLSERVIAANPMALFVHNSRRRLNLALQYACSDVQEIRDALAVVNSLFNFIESYSRRYASVLKSQKDNTVYETIRQLADNHWSSRRLSVIAIKQTFPVVLECLKYIDKNDRTILGFKAKCLLASIDSFEFYFTIQMLELILNRTRNLSDTLKTSSCELDTVFRQDIIHATVQSLYELRVDQRFTDLFHFCCTFADKFGIKTPEIKHTNADPSSIVYYDYTLDRTGPKVKFIEHKYHTLFFKIIDMAIEEIEFRYQDTTLRPIVQMANVIRNADAECVVELKKLQGYDELIDFNKLQHEVALWRHIRAQGSFNECCWSLRLENYERKNKSKSEVPSVLSKEKGLKLASNPYSIYEIYQAFNHLQLAKTLPQLDQLFRIYLAMPVSHTDVKQSRSVLKRSKHWLRSTMGKEVHDELALLNIERELTDAVDIDLVVDKYEERMHTLNIQ